jgi:hypothetical protein
MNECIAVRHVNELQGVRQQVKGRNLVRVQVAVEHLPAGTVAHHWQLGSPVREMLLLLELEMT